jgi:hypothetical protein
MLADITLTSSKVISKLGFKPRTPCGGSRQTKRIVVDKTTA